VDLASEEGRFTGIKRKLTGYCESRELLSEHMLSPRDCFALA